MKAFTLTRRQLLVSSVSTVVYGAGANASEYKPSVMPISSWKGTPAFLPLSKAFEALTSGPLTQRPPGRYELDGDRLYATITEDTTQDPAKGRFEVHHRYVDIHYLLAGAEMIGSADPQTLSVEKPYDEKGDAELFRLPDNYERLHLRPGSFTVFFPGQAHMPGRWDPKPEKIRKIVVKVLQA